MRISTDHLKHESRSLFAIRFVRGMRPQSGERALRRGRQHKDDGHDYGRGRKGWFAAPTGAKRPLKAAALHGHERAR